MRPLVLIRSSVLSMIPSKLAHAAPSHNAGVVLVPRLWYSLVHQKAVSGQ